MALTQIDRSAVREKAQRELKKRAAREHVLDFIQYCWSAPQPFVVGLHTKIIAARLDKAISDFKKGKSTFLVCMMPIRHGKSEVISRHLPPFFIGKCRQQEPSIISTGYGSDLVKGFSRKAKGIIGSQEFDDIFPGIRLCENKHSDAEWQVQYRRDGGLWRDSNGEVLVAGLLGPITGKGYQLGLVDDFCKGREDAESLTIREKTWKAFTDNFMSRRDPTGSITIITATPWHVDDLIGRIKKAMEKDFLFPQFEFYVFPAKGPGNANGEEIHYNQSFLFEERFPKLWYEQQYATEGKYSSSGLLDCDPQHHSGNVFDMTGVKIHDDIKDFPTDVEYVRFWDLASTEKERLKDDPDYTAGVLGTVTKDGIVPHLWLKDVVAGQWAAPKRQQKILATTERDGGGVKILVEQVGGYKDAVDTLKKILTGVREVIGVPVSVNKLIKGQSLEPVFEAGNVHILRADWNQMFFDHVGPFPYGTHDDVADGAIGVYLYFDTPDDGYFEFFDGDVMPRSN